MEDPLLSLRFHTTISKLLSTGTHITAEPVSKIDNLYNSEITTTLCLLYRLKDKLPSTGTHDQHSDGDSDAGSITTGGGDDSDADPQFVECIEVFSKLGHTVLGGKRSGEGEYERLCEEEEDVEEILVKLERRQGILESLLKRSMSGENTPSQRNFEYPATGQIQKKLQGLTFSDKSPVKAEETDDDRSEEDEDEDPSPLPLPHNPIPLNRYRSQIPPTTPLRPSSSSKSHLPRFSCTSLTPCPLHLLHPSLPPLEHPLHTTPLFHTPSSTSYFPPSPSTSHLTITPSYLLLVHHSTPLLISRSSISSISIYHELSTSPPSLSVLGLLSSPSAPPRTWVLSLHLSSPIVIGGESKNFIPIPGFDSHGISLLYRYYILHLGLPTRRCKCAFHALWHPGEFAGHPITTFSLPSDGKVHITDRVILVEKVDRAGRRGKEHVIELRDVIRVDLREEEEGVEVRYWRQGAKMRYLLRGVGEEFKEMVERGAFGLEGGVWGSEVVGGWMVRGEVAGFKREVERRMGAKVEGMELRVPEGKRRRKG